MKVKFKFIIISLALFSFQLYAQDRIIPHGPFMQNYECPVSIETTKTYEETWSRVLDYIAENNLPINTLEYNLGFIGASSIKMDYRRITAENKNGKPRNDFSWFVMPCSEWTAKVLRPHYTTMASYNIRIKNIGGNRTSVSVYLSCEETKYLSPSTGIEYISLTDCRSTGKFERDLLDYCK